METAGPALGGVVSHRRRRAARSVRALREIEAGRDTLHDVLGDAPTTFAFPYGELESFDDITPSLVAAVGFVSAWTTEGGAFGAVADRFRLPRCPVGTRSPDDLAAELYEWIA